MKTALKAQNVQSGLCDDGGFICCVCELLFTCLPLFCKVPVTLEAFFLS